MQGFVVVALGVAGVDGVVALGGEAVAFTLLGGQAALAEGDLVGADDRACGEELEGVVVFEDEDGVGAGGGGDEATECGVRMASRAMRVIAARVRGVRMVV